MKNSIYHYILVASLFIASSTTIFAQGYDFQFNWVLTRYATQPGSVGIEISTQHLPCPEIMFSVYAGAKIASLSYDPEAGHYLQEWIHMTKVDDDFDNFYLSFFFHDEFNMFDREVIVYTYGRNTHMAVVEKNTGELILFHPLNIGASDVDVADYNNDGIPELFVEAFLSIKIIDIITGQTIKEVESDYYNREICVGQFDKDSSLEIAMSNGSMLDLDTAQTQWNTNSAFVSAVNCDVDRDGIDELVCLHRSALCVFDAEKKSLKWHSIGVSERALLKICDVGADGTPDIATAYRHPGGNTQFSCFNGLTGELIWDFLLDLGNFTQFEVADLDCDDRVEIFATTYWGNFLIIDPFTTEVETLPYFIEFNHSTQVADFDSDGTLDLGVVTFIYEINDFSSSHLLLYDVDTHKVKDKIELSPEYRVYNMKTIDILTDSPGLEHLILGRGSDGNHIVLLNTHFEIVWDQKISSSFYNTDYIEISDLDGDGDLEIVILQEHISVFDAISGTKINHYDFSGQTSPPKHLNVGDIDNDGLPEISLIYDNDHLLILNGTTLEPKLDAYFDDELAHLIFAEVRPGIPGTEIIAVRRFLHDLIILSGITYELIDTIEITIENQSFFQAVDFNGDNIDEIFAATNSACYILDNFGQVLWESPITDGADTIYNAINISDYNNDGSQEFLFANRNKLFEYRQGGPAATPSPEPCFNPGVRLEMADDHLLAGDPFSLNAHLCNSTDSEQFNHHLLVALSLGGSYWFLPSWIDSNIDSDDYTYSVPPGEYTVPIIREFTWPDFDQSITGLSFIAALLNPTLTNMVGDIHIVTFDIGE